MNYFSNPNVVREVIVPGASGLELHAYTAVPLDCCHPYFSWYARYLLEAEALWLGTFFDAVIVHQF